MTKLVKFRLELGKTVITPAAQVFPGAFVMECLSKHEGGDWGLCCEEDTKVNNDEAVSGGRVLSVWELDGERLWIISEGSGEYRITTILCPSDY